MLPRVSWNLLVGALVIATACDRTPPAPAPVPPIAVAIDCGDDPVHVQVAGEAALDDAVCGAPWYAWQIETPRTVEFVRRIRGRTVWLRRRGAAVVVEVREGTRVTATHAGAAHVQWLASPQPPPPPDLLTLTRGESHELVTLAQLRDRYPKEPGSGRGKEVSLCALLEGAASTVEVREARAAPRTFTRATCEAQGLRLHASNRGGIQLRDRTKQRLMSQVLQIAVH